MCRTVELGLENLRTRGVGDACEEMRNRAVVAVLGHQLTGPVGNAQEVAARVVPVLKRIPPQVSDFRDAPEPVAHNGNDLLRSVRAVDVLIVPVGVLTLDTDVIVIEDELVAQAVVYVNRLTT